MVFPEFSVNCVRYCAAISLVVSSFSSQAENLPQWPVYAAHLSDEVQLECQSKQCELNVLDAEALQNLLQKHPLSTDVLDALTISEYELLISSAAVSNVDNEQSLVLEMTTSWRGVPVDDFNVSVTIQGSLMETAAQQIDVWVNRVQQENVFSAKRIYQTIEASDYDQHLHLPQKIGDFVFIETALYHDPMQGSISRYVHPQFDDAVVDVSVYPVSPFIHKNENAEPLVNEMEIEKSHIQKLIEQAKLDDYQISEIQSAEFASSYGQMKGLSMEVALQTRIDPVYSTQFLFTKNDKFIKVTGNLPKRMMLALVQESIGQIDVPQESKFMQSMRQQ